MENAELLLVQLLLSDSKRLLKGVSYSVLVAGSYHRLPFLDNVMVGSRWWLLNCPYVPFRLCVRRVRGTQGKADTGGGEVHCLGWQPFYPSLHVWLKNNTWGFINMFLWLPPISEPCLCKSPCEVRTVIKDLKCLIFWMFFGLLLLDCSLVCNNCFLFLKSFSFLSAKWPAPG